jgi:hypothetical protein
MGRAVIRRTLKKIHIRLWHAPTARMNELLLTAGVKQEVLNPIQVIIDTCPTCRAWQSRGVRPVHDARCVDRPRRDPPAGHLPEVECNSDRGGPRDGHRPQRNHAQMIERHNALLRDAPHYIDGQMMRDGSAVPPQAILDEALLAKNCLISIQGAD